MDPVVADLVVLVVAAVVAAVVTTLEIGVPARVVCQTRLVGGITRTSTTSLSVTGVKDTLRIFHPSLLRKLRQIPCTTCVNATGLV